jgi:DNA (cytosine-5)-methyltransferase 1
MQSMHLFAGIGGAALGFQRAGITPVALCEIDPWCQKVLRRHWPKAYLHDDVRTLKREYVKEHINVITGGFPCQDISGANRNAVGLGGARSSLWYEQLRLVDEFRPDFVVAENSHMLRSRGLDALLRSLDEVGYDAEWHCIPACYLGAWHKRDRIWVLAYPRSQLGCKGITERPLLRQSDLSRPLAGSAPQWPGRSNLPSPRLCGGNDGVPERAHRLKGLGNSVYTLIPEMIAHVLYEKEIMS